MPVKGVRHVDEAVAAPHGTRRVEDVVLRPRDVPALVVREIDVIERDPLSGTSSTSKSQAG